jgi:hypothetical protein
MMYYGGTPTGMTCPSVYRHVLQIVATSDTQWTIRDMERDGMPTLYTHAVDVTYQTTGTMLTGMPTCGSDTDYGDIYSATTNQILFHRGPFDSGCYNGVTLVMTFTKQ